MSIIDQNAAHPYYSSIEYPITYGVVMWVRMLTVAISLLFIGGGGWVLLDAILQQGISTLIENPILLFAYLAIDGLMVYWICWAFNARIILKEDSFEFRRPLSSRLLMRSDIEGRRYTTGRAAGYPIIVPIHGAPFSLDSSAYGLDERFNQWFASLPDAQAIDNARALEDVKNDQTLGIDAVERLARAQQKQSKVRFVLSALCVVAIVLTVGTFANALPSRIIVAVAGILPWCSLLALWWGRAALKLNDGARRVGSLSVFPLLFPSIVLALQGLAPRGWLDLTPAMAWGVVAGLPLLLAVCVVTSGPRDRGAQKAAQLLIFGLYAWLYGAGLVASIDRVFDNAAAQVFSTTVTDKFATRGRGHAFYLQTTSWGPRTDGDVVAVPASQYYEINKGDVICMGVHPGRLGWPWIHQLPCEP